MSLFATLAPHAAIAPVTVMILDAGEGNVRAIITQKKDEGGKKPGLTVSVTGTPAELDAELPLALAEAAALPAKSVAEQVAAQKQGSAANPIVAPKVKPMKAPAKKPAPKKPAPKKAAPKPAAKKPAPKPAPAKKATAKPARREVQTELPLTGTAEEKKAQKRAACLADLARLQALHGGKLTRKNFAAESRTGRSFETVFGSWEAFIAAGQAETKPPSEETTPAGAETAPLPAEKAAPSAETPAPVPAAKSAASTTTPIDLF